jgi:hypothetical protein
MLVGFDGTSPVLPDGMPPGAAGTPGGPGFVRAFGLPHGGNYGNAVRRALIKAARGERFLFLDDDNALTPEAFRVYEAHPDADLVVARIDTSRAFDVSFLPRDDGTDPIRPANVDPLCLCVARELLVTRCGGWGTEGRYESDYRNILRYARRARRMETDAAVVGVYDAGAHLDPGARNPRQERRSCEVGGPD